MQESKQQTPWDGMLPQHPCKWCGKLLNQDGYHPAELYAGTYTGLCYACEGLGPRILQEFYDGCKLVSHPPSSPSYRRNRDEHYWYPDCSNKKCNMGTVWEWRPYVPGLGGGSYRSYCPDCLRRHCAWTEGREQRKLQGQTPYEELAARFQAASQVSEQESEKRTTKTRTKERKAFLYAVSRDYRSIAQVIRSFVLQDREEHLPDVADDQVRSAQQRIAADPGSILFPDERLAVLQEAAKDLRQALPAQREAKRRQTQVLM
jgi:hypothetical protein